MNDIDNMPSKCQSCPYWEACEYPYICDDIKPKQHENGNLNAEFAENPQDRLTDGLIWKRDALDAIHCNITVTGRQNAELVSATIGAFADRIKALPPVKPKRGKWIDAVIPNDNGGLLVQVCDQCNTFFPLAYTGGGHRFCPNCGADMRTKETDCDYERAVEQLEHDMLYEPTFDPDDGSM